MNFKKLLPAARQEEKCDTLFKNAKIANLYTMEYEEADIAVKDGIIIGVGEGYEGRETIECAKKIIAPGFIEGHIHVESTFMLPKNLAAAVAPLGTTTMMPDPHEIANTCGAAGVRFMERESRGLPIDFYYGAPSCVPASAHETPFEPIEADEIKELLTDGSCTHLGEMMNFPGVFLGDCGVWAKLDAASDVVITGHAPTLSGPLLCSYLLGGVTSDHECASKEEALEKLRRGLYLMIREGATARNLKALAPILADAPYLANRCLAVSDDISPDFIRERGHLNGCLKELIECGVPPLAALRTITLTPAEYFRLHDRGAVAPGKIADLVMMPNLESGRVEKVWKNGCLVAESGKMTASLDAKIPAELPGNRKQIKTPHAEELRVKIPDDASKINIIETVPGQVFTKTAVAAPRNENGFACADAANDTAKMTVVEKNRGTGKFSTGFIKGLGLKRGAIASSVAHDAHNYTCAGMDDVSMAAALAELARIKGGVVIADGEKILAELELPVGGLISLLDAEALCGKTAELAAAREALGCRNPHVMMQLSFMSLTVIPELKLTDQGYYDISAGGKKPLFMR